MWRGAGVVVAMLMLGTPAGAQASGQSPDCPTAETADWYQRGEPLLIDGQLYYRVGPIQHFNADEMVRSGYLDAVPIYTRTTQEPRSIVYVPLSGGLVRPYERRRDGDLAGTVGSTAPALPVTIPASHLSRTLRPVRAPGPPTGHPVGMWGSAATGHARSVALAQPAGDSTLPDPPVPTSGILRTARPAEGLNAAFIEYQAARWFLAGPPELFDAARFERIGEYFGFGVYRDPSRPARVYVPSVDGPPGLLTPYAAR